MPLPTTLLTTSLFVRQKVVDRHLAYDGLMERDEALGARYAEGLQLVVYEVEQVVIVDGIDLDEQVVVV